MTELAPPVNCLFDGVSPDTSDSESSEGSRTGGGVPKSTDIGKRVLYYSTADKKIKYGTLRFLGETEFEPGTWCGVELNNGSGKNNGTCKGIRYFNCEPNHGIFVLLSKIELDFGRRSRPNSTPNSRNTSIDRESPSKVPAPPSKVILTLQQQIVNRLSAPVHRRNKTTNQPIPNNRRQPLKAFATKGLQREELKEKKLHPFKACGMIKARSTDNISKEGSSTLQPKMSSKKSSSERDLRGVGKKGPPTAKKDPKLSRKGRVNSCSDLSTEPSPNRTVLHPKTSTPIEPRDQLAPDGCSSPDDDSGSNTSQTDDQALSKTPVVAEIAFIESPNVNQPTKEIVQGSLYTKTSLEGLEYAHVKLIREELKTPSFNNRSVKSPETSTNKLFKNRTSGSATLEHPLVTAKHEPADPQENTDNGVNYSELLDPNIKLEGVTVPHVLAAFRQLHKQFVQERSASSGLLENTRQEYSVTIAKLERQQRTALKELVEKHQGELRQFSRAHEYKIKQVVNGHGK